MGECPVGGGIVWPHLLGGASEGRGAGADMVEVDGWEEEVDTTTTTPAPYDESGARWTWEVLTWIILALTILLNLTLMAILVIKRNLNSITNKMIFTVAVSDLAYGCLVSPFFVENYVKNE